MTDPNYRISIATTLKEITKIKHFRHRVYCEQLHAFPATKKSREEDRYDTRSTHFMIRVKRKIVATVRLVPECDGTFPIEEHGFTVPQNVSRDRTLEVSRFIAEAVKGHSPAIDILHAAYDWSLANGCVYWLFSVNAAARGFLAKYRWRMDPLGEEKLHHGAMYVPYGMPLTEPDRFNWK